MRVARLAAIAALSLSVAPVPGCSDATLACACTDEYRMYIVTLVDDALQPVDGATLTRTDLRTGRVLVPRVLALLARGVYMIADDGLVDEFSSDGDVVRVTGTAGGGSFTADFVFATPEPCRCHVERLGGPDTVVVGEPPPRPPFPTP
jgi:hypothetical protein